MKTLATIIFSLAIALNLGAAPAMAMTMSHAMTTAGHTQLSAMNGHAATTTDCVAGVCQDATGSDCAAHCLAASMAIHDGQAVVLLLVIVLLCVAALLALPRFTAPVRILRFRIFPPPLYLFATVRLIE